MLLYLFLKEKVKPKELYPTVIFVFLGIVILKDFSFSAAFSFRLKRKSGKESPSLPLKPITYFPNSAMPSAIFCSDTSRQWNAKSELWAPSAFST